MIFAQHGHQLGRNALRHDNRSPTTDAYDFNVRNLAQSLQDILKALVAEHEGVAARQKYIAYARGTANIIDRRIDLLLTTRLIGSTGNTPSSAMPAIHRTLVGD